MKKSIRTVEFGMSVSSDRVFVGFYRNNDDNSPRLYNPSGERLQAIRRYLHESPKWRPFTSLFHNFISVYYHRRGGGILLSVAQESDK